MKTGKAGGAELGMNLAAVDGTRSVFAQVESAAPGVRIVMTCDGQSAARDLEPGVPGVLDVPFASGRVDIAIESATPTDCGFTAPRLLRV